MPDDKKVIIKKFAHGVKDILGESLKRIILYGSCTRGNFDDSSDIDIMILTTLTDVEIEDVEGKIFDLAFDFMMDYGVDISVIVKNEVHFNYWLGAVPFYDNVQREGVVLNG
ncbi:MAG: nucleotidyltransferase domain-containing protein [Clostridiales bacterium]|nr:nucleotidyltransferase domain-containing protein [Clostridiales bacterium]